MKYVGLTLLLAVVIFGAMVALVGLSEEPEQLYVQNESGEYVPAPEKYQPESNFQTAVEAGRETASETLATLRLLLCIGLPVALLLILARGFTIGTRKRVDVYGNTDTATMVAMGKNAQVDLAQGRAGTGQQPQLPQNQQVYLQPEPKRLSFWEKLIGKKTETYYLTDDRR